MPWLFTIKCSHKFSCFVLFCFFNIFCYKLLYLQNRNQCQIMSYCTKQHYYCSINKQFTCTTLPRVWDTWTHGGTKFVEHLAQTSPNYSHFIGPTSASIRPSLSWVHLTSPTLHTRYLKAPSNSLWKSKNRGKNIRNPLWGTAPSSIHSPHLSLQSNPWFSAGHVAAWNIVGDDVWLFPANGI